jgi:PIN domain nuclease of toxin-antitoxin system
MAERVLDASVIIAIANHEPYNTDLLPVFDGAVMSSVNFAEVITRLLDLGIDPASPPVQRALALLGAVESFTPDQGLIAGELRRLGKHVALGDRACMALAIDLAADIYTADKEWKHFAIGVTVHLIR